MSTQSRIGRLEDKAEQTEKAIEKLEKELKENGIIHDLSDYGHLTLRVDVPKLKDTQDLILNYLGVETVYAHKKLKKKKSMKEG